MGFLNRLFGYRWSVYIVRNDNELLYALQEHCPITLTGYLTGYFKEGRDPVAPWSLHLNYNRTHQAFQLTSQHFNGEMQSAELIQRIEDLDPKWRNRCGKEPVFIEPATKRVLPLSETTTSITAEGLQSMIDNAGKPPTTTYCSVMDEVFRRKN